MIRSVVRKGHHVGINCDGNTKKCDYMSMKIAIMNVCGTEKHHEV